ncbi:uncharacterized protein TRAVEDRAFT_127409, partial [Trametes versicolor FP-101664 SS1]|uniref:uncharacterized protein n=1 Tax=Trametes versicolor (strain FP-101664) TaxID=717944 RepID=UPI0004622F03
PQVQGLSKLVKPFPAEARPEFVNTYKKKLQFPFNDFINQHHHTSPDISVSFPGKSLSEPSSWGSISTVIESKSESTQDPFIREAQTHTDTIEQLAKNARNLIITHGLLAAFVVGIYGNTVRLVRFDHTCALVSVPFNIKKDGPRLLQKFYWHFTHPVVGAHIVGNDPTVMSFTSADDEWVRSELKKARILHWQVHVAEVSKGRRVEVYDEATGRCIPYLLYQVVDVNGRLFSRSTMVWRAIEDTRIWKNGRLEPDPSRITPVKPQIMKEAWRQLVRTAEAKFYQRLQRDIDEEDWHGLATMVCGGDLGEFEVRWWKETERRRKGVAAASGDADPRNAPDSPGAFNAASSSRLFSSRSHMRIVIDDVGRPLTEFKSTRELVCAIRDAIRGHQLAWKKARVMHRDISVGNILISDEPKPSKKAYTGFLHDYDYSQMEDDPSNTDEDSPSPSSPSSGSPDGSPTTTATAPDDPSKLRERTGTYYFMACEILDVPGIIHHTHHDLESFYWVLLWVVVRHTDHRNHRGKKLCAKIFKFGNDEDSADAKKTWVDHKASRFNVYRNKPLSHLLRSFNKLVKKHLSGDDDDDVAPVPLDYGPVLKVFDEAIAMSGWPDNDWKACDLLGGLQRTGMAGVVDPKQEKKKGEKPLGVTTAPLLGKAAATGRQPVRKVHFADLPPLPDHPDIPAPRTYHGDPQQPFREPSKKRSHAFVEESSELDSRGIARTSRGNTKGHSKRPKTSERMGPVTRSKSQAAPQAAMQSSESVRRSARIQEKRLASGDA